jgi:hypothetical protein
MWIGRNVHRTVLRLAWPPEVVQLAGVLLQHLAAERIRPMARCHTATWSDNSPETCWSTKMADKATTPIAAQLLQALAMRQITTRSALPTAPHCAGSRNLLADTASRSFAKFHHGNAGGTPSNVDFQFLTSFNSSFPLSDFPQMPLWQLVTLLSETSSSVILTLLGKKLPMPRWTVPPAPLTGATRPRGVTASREQHAHTLMAFAARVPAGAFGHGRQVGGQTVATTLRHVFQAFVRAAWGDPR